MARRESLPGFIADVMAWRGSNAIRRMSMAERGVYWEMLIEQWLKRYLPDDAQAVADAIATTQSQVDEVLAAWPVVRRKFTEATNGVQRIYNVQLEATRKKQVRNLQKWSNAGRVAGKASANKRRRDKQLPTNDRSTTVNDSERLATIEVSRVEVSRGEESKDRVPRETGARPWSGPVIGRNPHISHASCGPNLQWCVPAAVHAKLAELLAPKHQGDRDVAKEHLTEWYESVWAELPADYVMRGDAFKWWEAKFDAAFVTETPSQPQTNKRITGLVAGGNAFLQGK